MRVVWPCEHSPKDPPEYSAEEEEEAMKVAEERLMRKKAAGLLRPKLKPAATVTSPKAPKSAG